MKDFKKITPKPLPTNDTEQTIIEKRETRKFKNYKVVKDIPSSVEPISVNFAKKNFHNMLFTTSQSLTFYDFMSDNIITNYHANKNASYACATIREDGKLIASGNTMGEINVFEPYTKLELQKYKAFKLQVNSIDILNNKVIGCSNDTTLNYFSLETKKPIVEFKNISKDYLLVNKFISENIIVTGGYDKKIKILDIRTGKAELDFFSSNNSIINDICFSNISNGLLVASNDTITQYDINYLSSNFNNFTDKENKISFVNSTSPMSSTIKKMILTDKKIFSISNSGEKYLYVNDLFTLNKLYSVNLKTEILDLDLVNSLSKYATISSTGQLQVYEKTIKESTEEAQANDFNNSNQFNREMQEDYLKYNPENFAEKTISKNYAYFNRGQYENTKDVENKMLIDDVVVVKPEKEKKEKLKSYDQFLKKFMFKEALLEVLKTKNPFTIVSLIEYLVVNGYFYNTILKMDDDELSSVLIFINSRILSPNYQTLLINVFSEIVNYYFAFVSDNEYTISGELMVEIKNKLKTEIELKKRIIIFQNKIDLNKRINNVGM